MSLTSQRRKYCSQVEKLEQRKLLSASSLDSNYGTNGIAALGYSTDGVNYTGVLLSTNDHQLVLTGGSSGGASGEAFLARLSNNGIPDSTYGTNGIATDAPLYNAYDAAIDPTNSIIVVNGNLSQKFTPNGAIDTSWTGPGTVSALSATTRQVIARSNGGVFVITNTAVVALTATGTLDSTFGTGGVYTFPITTNFSTNAQSRFNAFAGAISPAGNLILAGDLDTITAGTHQAQLLALASNGTPTNILNNNSSSTFTFSTLSSTNSSARTIVFDGMNFVVGGLNGSAAFLSRLNVYGMLDPTFDAGGIDSFSLNAGGSNTISEIQIDSQDRYVTEVSGASATGTYLIRLNNTGALDKTFNQTGTLFTEISPTAVFNFPGPFTIEPSNQIVYASTIQQTGNDPRDISVERINTDGTIDTTFGDGSGGTGLTHIATTGPAWLQTVGRSTLQTDGKLLLTSNEADIASNALVARFNADGSPDNIFGNGGVVSIDFGTAQDAATATAVQSNGYIVVVGTAGATNSATSSNTDFAIARLDPNGRLDPNFGTTSSGETLTSSGGSYGRLSQVAIESSGYILAAGIANVGNGNIGDLVRYTASGSLDPNFGSGGILKLTPDGVATDEAVITQITPLTGGKFLVSGYQSVSAGGEDFVARLNDDGTYDTTFATNGVYLGGVINSQISPGSAIDAQGNIYLAGFGTPSGGATTATVTKLTAAGVVDSSFGTSGVASIPLNSTDLIASFARTPLGALVFAGTRKGASYNEYLVAQLTATGAVDTSFAPGGVTLIDLGNSAKATSVNVAAGGQILVSGSLTTVSTFPDSWGVARLLGNPIITPAISSTVMGDGTNQRSTIHSFSVTFNEPVTFASGAYTLDKLPLLASGAVDTGGTPTDVTAGISISSADNTTWTFTVNGGGSLDRTAGGTAVGDLTNGVYQLVLHGAAITDAASGTAVLNSGSDQIAQFYSAEKGSASNDFHCLFGDMNGDGTVNLIDYRVFTSTYLASTGSAKYLAAADYDGSGSINLIDYRKFTNDYLASELY